MTETPECMKVLIPVDVINQMASEATDRGDDTVALAAVRFPLPDGDRWEYQWETYIDGGS